VYRNYIDYFYINLKEGSKSITAFGEALTEYGINYHCSVFSPQSKEIGASDR